MFTESARVESRCRAWHREVSVSPYAAINRIHEAGVARQNPNRQAAADYLAVGGQGCLNAEPCLCPTGENAKSCHDLIKNQSHTGVFRHPPKVRQKPESW